MSEIKPPQSINVGLSVRQGGRGVALRNTGKLTQIGNPISIGTSPGQGTYASIFLATNNDHAYDNAVITWYVKQFGRLAQFATTIIDPADNANQPYLVYTVGGFASEFWEATITLTSATLPAVQLFNSVTAFGVEDIPPGGGGGTFPFSAPVVFSETFTGPGGSGAALLPTTGLPAGTSTWIVTVTMRVVSSGVDPVGASYVTSETFAWESVAGVASLVPILTASPFSASDAIMATAVIPDPTATGNQAEIPFTLPTGLNAATVTKVTVSMSLLSSVF